MEKIEEDYFKQILILSAFAQFESADESTSLRYLHIAVAIFHVFTVQERIISISLGNISRNHIGGSVSDMRIAGAPRVSIEHH